MERVRFGLENVVFAKATYDSQTGYTRFSMRCMANTLMSRHVTAFLRKEGQEAKQGSGTTRQKKRTISC